MNWKTTLFGALSAACGYLSHNVNPIVQTIGQVGALLFTTLLGSTAADAKKR